jgi:hypothetical protein
MYLSLSRSRAGLIDICKPLLGMALGGKHTDRQTFQVFKTWKV